MNEPFLKNACLAELKQTLTDWLKLNGQATPKQVAQLVARVHKLCEYLESV